MIRFGSFFISAANMSFINVIRGWIFYLCLSVSIICLTVGVLVSLPFTSVKWRYDVFGRNWAKLVLWMLDVICGVKLAMKGMENMPSASMPAVVLVKHQSAWDPFWLGAYLPAPACFIYKRSINWIPLLGWVVWSMNFLAIDRSKGRSAFEAFVKMGPEKLKEGWWITLFPEGTRVRPGEHVRYKTGGARFACQTGTPIVPICHNAGWCWPKNSIAKVPGTITVSVGPVIETKGREPHEVTAEVEAWIENELERLGRGTR